ncbi:MAG: hypothetical protein NC349_10300 [Paenibacillus sp.]|nr:hypothetical protein [Paenibacillus sp.]
MKGIKATLLILIIIGLCSHAQKISFAYDAIGNRVRRELVMSQPAKSNANNKGDSYYDLLGDRTIQLIHTPEGLIKIYIPDFDENDNAYIDVNSISGVLVFVCDIKDTLTVIDLNGQPDDIYILRVVINGNHTTWKITKN